MSLLSDLDILEKTCIKAPQAFGTPVSRAVQELLGQDTLHLITKEKTTYLQNDIYTIYNIFRC